MCTLMYVASSVCEISFEAWDNTLPGHDKVFTDLNGVVWALC